MERHVERKEQRNQAGQTRGVEWNGGFFLSGAIPNLLPLTFYSFTIREARDFRIHGTRLANIIFLLLPRITEFTIFIIRCFAVTR